MSKKHEVYLPGRCLGNSYAGKMTSKSPRSKKWAEDSRSLILSVESDVKKTLISQLKNPWFLKLIYLNLTGEKISMRKNLHANFIGDTVKNKKIWQLLFFMNSMFQTSKSYMQEIMTYKHRCLFHRIHNNNYYPKPLELPTFQPSNPWPLWPVEIKEDKTICIGTYRNGKCQSTNMHSICQGRWCACQLFCHLPAPWSRRVSLA